MPYASRLCRLVQRLAGRFPLRLLTNKTSASDRTKDAWSPRNFSRSLHVALRRPETMKTHEVSAMRKLGKVYNVFHLTGEAPRCPTSFQLVAGFHDSPPGKQLALARSDDKLEACRTYKARRSKRRRREEERQGNKETRRI